MTTMIREIYEALREAGASEEKATAAAEVLFKEFLTRDNRDRLATNQDMQQVREGIKEDIQQVREEIRKVEADLAVVKAELAIVKWLVGGIGFGVLLLVIKSFWPA